MSARASLEKLLEHMPEDRLREIVDFAAFLNWQDERDGWRQFGQAQLARAYGPDEPDYDADSLEHVVSPVQGGLPPDAANLVDF